MRKTRVLAAVVLSALSSGMIACDDATDLDDGQWVANLSPANEVGINPLIGDPTSTGVASMSLNDGVLTVSIVIDGLLTSGATGAHIHGAANTLQNADIIFDFTPAMADAIASGQLTGTILNASFDLNALPVTTDGILRVDAVTLLNLMNAGQAYVNVHTTLNPDGETRGQIAPF